MNQIKNPQTEDFAQKNAARYFSHGAEAAVSDLRAFCDEKKLVKWEVLALVDRIKQVVALTRAKQTLG